MRFASILGSLALSAWIASSALASTFIVDVNGSGQFTDIPPAIAAAQDGDVIIVLPGTYSPFTLTKALTIVGRGNVIATGSALAISNIPAGNRAAVVNLRASGLSIANCAGHVVVQDVTPASTGAPFTLGVTSSADVRLRGLTSGAVVPQSSRIEMTHCWIEGASGASAPTHPWDGEPGLVSGGGNLLHMVSTAIVGGNGGDADFSWAGNGGAALMMAPNDLVIFSGGLLQGGNGGYSPTGFQGLPCFYCGFGAAAVSVSASATFRYSTSSLQGGYSTNSVTCSPVQEAWNSGSGTFLQATPGDPSLDFVSIPVPGYGVQFVVYGPPGSLVRLNFGREPIVVADGLAVVARLAASARVVNLGVVPASGQVTLNWIVPAIPSGTWLVSQAEVVLQGGELRRTNSVPVIVR